MTIFADDITEFSISRCALVWASFAGFLAFAAGLGESPQPAAFQSILNRYTAKASRFTIPAKFLLRVEKAIER